MTKEFQQYLISVFKAAQNAPRLEPPENPTEIEQWLWDEYGIKKVKSSDPIEDGGLSFPRENLIWIALSEMEKIDDAELNDEQREYIKDLQRLREEHLIAMASKGADDE